MMNSALSKPAASTELRADDPALSSDSALADVQLLAVLRAARSEGRLLCFLDYDGTLAEIVPDPAKALMSVAMRSALHALPSAGVRTAIVTGRSLDKIKIFTASLGSPAQFCFAASHGFDIEGAGTHLRPFAVFRPLLIRAAGAMEAALVPFPGAAVEDNFFSVTAHLRCVDEPQRAGAERAVRDAVRRLTEGEQVAEGEATLELELRPGKLVLEARPLVEWDKGRACDAILARPGDFFAAWGGGTTPALGPLVVLAIGDDLTDEDTFSALLAAERDGRIALAVPVIVGAPERATFSRYRLGSVDEVRRFLEALLAV